MSSRNGNSVDAPGPLLGALLRLAYQDVIAEVMRRLGEAGFGDLQPAHSAAMRPLWDHPEGVRATELAAAARITKQSMGALLAQLEERQYVTRIDDPNDRRAKLVVLTRRGHAAGRLMRVAVRSVENDWARRIGADRVAALRATLTDLAASLDRDR